MLSIGIAIALTLVGQDQSKSPAAKVLIEKMMNRYYSAQTLTGTIKLTVSTEAGSASLDTVLQYERPAKLYIRQQKNVANPDPGQPSKWLVTSDGTSFSYDIPNHKYESAPDSGAGAAGLDARLSGGLIVTAQTSGRRDLMAADDDDAAAPGAQVRAIVRAGPVVAVGRLVGDNRLKYDPDFAGTCPSWVKGMGTQVIEGALLLTKETTAPA